MEQFEPIEDGYKLKFVKETKLLREDGTKPFLVGTLQMAYLLFYEIPASCNGKTLIIHTAEKDLYFDVETGKNVLKNEGVPD